MRYIIDAFVRVTEWYRKYIYNVRIVYVISCHYVISLPASEDVKHGGLKCVLIDGTRNL